MSPFCLVSNKQVVGNPQNYKFYPFKANYLDRCVCRTFNVLSKNNFVSLYAPRSQLYSYFRGEAVSCSKMKSIHDKNDEIKASHMEGRKNIDVKRRFSLRIRPRLRLLSTRLKRVQIRSALNDFGMFLRKHLKKVTIAISISIAIGVCYLFVKILSVPFPKSVPYSDLVVNLQSGSVSKVLFEEGSRRIYFNTKLENSEDSKREVESLPLEHDQTDNVERGVSIAASVTPQVKNTDVAASVPLELDQIDNVDSGVAIAASVTPQVKNTDVAASVTPQVKNTDMVTRSARKRTPLPEWQYSTRKVDNDERFLLNLMRENAVAYSSAPQSVMMSIRTILLTILTLWIPLTPLMWILYRQLNSANSPAKKRKPINQTVSFDDVEGVDSAKVELMEIVLCLQGAINYNKLGARLPRGVLLVGPPGTGKTLLARAVAGEAGVPFFSVSASEFVELFVGRGAARIRDLFNVARKCSPSIIFIDELDAVGGKRGRSFNDERDQTLNQLLTEMDGFESDTKVVVIAATNRPEALDEALCRPGRFSRKVVVGEPDEEGRRKILAVHMRNVPLEEDMQLLCNLVASLTQGLVGADLANIVNEAALLAARRGGEAVSREDIMEAIERAKFGINNKPTSQSAISKELGKLFPWMPSLMGKSDPKTEAIMRPLGYQSLSS